MSDSKDSDWVWSGFREKCRRIIFLHNKPAEKLFDLHLRGRDARLHLGFDNVPDRGAGKWIHQHSEKHVLGDCDADDGWLWRSFASNDLGSVLRFDYHAYGLRNHRRANRNRNG